MKRIEIKVIRMPSGKYLCKPAWGGLTQTSKLSQAIKWYGKKGEIDKYNKDFWIKNIDLNDYKVEVQADED